ncbi:MAG: hypothetical protein M5U34_46565 [Chloroflexi bacterium]|nr:hypothetical protein [Chloroflexota bacterium]
MLVEGGQEPVIQPDRFFHHLPGGIGAGDGVAVNIGQQRQAPFIHRLPHRQPRGQPGVKAATNLCAATTSTE